MALKIYALTRMCQWEEPFQEFLRQTGILIYRDVLNDRLLDQMKVDPPHFMIVDGEGLSVRETQILEAIHREYPRVGFLFVHATIQRDKPEIQFRWLKESSQAHLSSHVNFPSPYDNVQNVKSVSDLEYRSLLQALHQSGGNISRTAKLLGVGRDTIYRRLKKYNISPKRDGINIEEKFMQG